MTFTDAAAEVLRLVGRPLHYKEITDIAIEKNLLSHVGKSPEVTMGSRLAATVKKESDDNRLVRVKPGVFALRVWDEKTIRAGLEGRKGKKTTKDLAREDAATEPSDAEVADDDDVELPEAEVSADIGDEHAVQTDAAEAAAPAAADDDDNEVLVPRAQPSIPRADVSSPRALGSGAGEPRASRPGWSAGSFDDEEEVPAGPDEAMRAEAAAGAAEIFDEEEDDDQPILGGDDRSQSAGVDSGDGRRRRRRRRRGRGTLDGVQPSPSTAGNGLPAYTATPLGERESRGEVRDYRERELRGDGRDRDRGDRRGRDYRDDAEPGLRGPQVIDLGAGDGAPLDDLAGRDLADGIAALLATFDRNAGAVSLRQIAETALRRGRLAGDAQLMQSQVAAAVRADNARRVAQGQRPRFRFAGGRVSLTDWLLSSELTRLEQEAVVAVERYRDAARRTFARKLSELPGHAFVELCMLALERIGIGNLRALRRAGSGGGESHFTGTLRVPSGDEVRLAIVIRRDGREVGRERVTELRGALHHYNTATAAWVLTAGQVLTGAREEAAAVAAPPVALFDGLAVARLCEEHDVGVIRARLPIAIPDVDLLEALRAS